MDGSPEEIRGFFIPHIRTKSQHGNKNPLYQNAKYQNISNYKLVLPFGT
jgi:hypothetical protein